MVSQKKKLLETKNIKAIKNRKKGKRILRCCFIKLSLSITYVV